VPAAGHCLFEARWVGDTDECRLTLQDPSGAVVSAPGGSPLTLEIEVSDAQTAHAGAWRVEIAPTGAKGTARGELVAELPRPPAPPGPRSATPGDACATGRTILEDGSVQLTYPDGTIVTYYASGGFGIESPDGVNSQAMCMSVPPMAPPPIPDDPLVNSWLQAIEADLLDQIRALVNDEDAVNRYLNSESGAAPTIYDRIRQRIDVLGRLLQ
jgi:hypothetical protein